MLAPRGVEAFVGDLKALNGPATENVLLDNLFGIGQSHAAVPHAFGIHDNRGTMLALIEAPGLVGTHRRLGTGDRQKALEFAMEERGTRRVATATRVSFRPLITANEDVFVELRHWELRTR